MTIKIYRSTTAGNVPASLSDGQLAINEADEILFYKNASGAIKSLAMLALARVFWRTVGDAAYPILATDRTLATSTAFTAARTWTLPAANSVPAGTTFRFIDLAGAVSATNTLTIAPNGSDTVVGGSGVVLGTPRFDFTLTSDGSSKWGGAGALGVERGGTGASTAATARSSLGAAASGANSDITGLSGLTTALSVAQGGTGGNTAGTARAALKAAVSGANADITSVQLGGATTYGGTVPCKSVGTLGTATANFAAIAPGTGQGQTVGYDFYPTFQNTSDNGPRRAATIQGRFNGGNWGTETLDFLVGFGGSADDAGNLDNIVFSLAGTGPSPNPLPVNQGGIGTATAGGGALDNVLGIPGAAQAAAAVLVRTAAATYSFVASTTFAASARKLIAGVGLAGGGDLTADRTLNLSRAVNPQTGTAYTVAASDAFKVITLSNASAVAVTLPQATTAGFGAGNGFTFINLGAGAVTITPTTSTVNGAASITLATGQSADLTSDGTNYAAALGSAAASASGGSGAPSATIATTSGTNVVAAAADKGKLYNLVGSSTLQLPAAVQVAGWYAWVNKLDGVGSWSIAPASVTIDGLAAITIYGREGSYLIEWDAQNSVFRTVGRPRGLVDLGSTTIASAVASLGFTFGFGDAELRDIQFGLEQVALSASDNLALQVRKSGAYQNSGYAGQGIFASAGSATGSTAATNCLYINYNSASSQISGDVTLSAVSSTAPQRITIIAGSASGNTVGTVIGQQSTAAATTGMLLYALNGSNITGGIINQRGYRR